MSLLLRKSRAVLMTAFVLCLFVVCTCTSQAQTPTPKPSPTPTPSTSSGPCAMPPACPTLAPRVLQLTARYKKGEQPLQDVSDGIALPRKHFYLSPCPFNLDKVPGAKPAPTRKAYYTSVKASDQLIKWLEANNCDTVYCRELTKEEVTCNAASPTCVPEFTRSYNEALQKLNGNAELARKWVTNYAPLSSVELRLGFYTEKQKWLDATVAAEEKASGLPPGTIKTTMTDKGGIAYFYDLCPGTYYISSIAPVEVEGDRILWETTAITIKGTKAGDQDQLTVTPIFLANVPSKKKRSNFFVGKKLTDVVSTSSTRVVDERLAVQ
jgi:hypothetical protein